MNNQQFEFGSINLELQSSWEQVPSYTTILPKNNQVDSPFQIQQIFSQNQESNEFIAVLEIYYQNMIYRFQNTYKPAKNSSNSAFPQFASPCKLNQGDLKSKNAPISFEHNGIPIVVLPFENKFKTNKFEENIQIKAKQEQNLEKKTLKCLYTINLQDISVQVGFDYVIEQKNQEFLQIEEQKCLIQEPVVEQPQIEQEFPQIGSIQDLKNCLAFTLEKDQKRRKKSSSHFFNEYQEETTADIHSNDTCYEIERRRRGVRKNSTFGKCTPIKINMSDDESYSNYTQKSCNNNNNPNKKGDKKNVVKNFTKAFRAFLHDSCEIENVKRIAGLQEKSEVDSFRGEWMQFEKANHYNNKLIKQLITSKKYSELFGHFLENRASKWLSESSVQDKKSHFEVLQGYIRASQNPDELDSIVILKSRN